MPELNINLQFNSVYQLLVSLNSDCSITMSVHKLWVEQQQLKHQHRRLYIIYWMTWREGLAVWLMMDWTLKSGIRRLWISWINYEKILLIRFIYSRTLIFFFRRIICVTETFSCMWGMRVERLFSPTVPDKHHVLT